MYIYRYTNKDYCKIQTKWSLDNKNSKISIYQVMFKFMKFMIKMLAESLKISVL